MIHWEIQIFRSTLCETLSSTRRLEEGDNSKIYPSRDRNDLK